MINHKVCNQSDFVIANRASEHEKIHKFYTNFIHLQAHKRGKEKKYKKMSKSLKIEKPEKLISEYKREICLCNVCAPDYKNRKVNRSSLRSCYLIGEKFVGVMFRRLKYFIG